MRLRHYLGTELEDNSLGRSELVCSKCYAIKSETGISPLCETSDGCPIYDLATNPIVSRMVKEFTAARMLFDISKSETVYNKMCEDFGFYDDLPFHYEAEAIYLEWKQIKQRQKANRGPRSKRG